ncbi:MAG: TIGR02680 family protein [Clostridiales bacterium]|nr:TIGR02680 family protein [Clostridiales bacterium]
MLLSKWEINRIGLIDFWYYDDEEFKFEDGRLLLRGANGSGKSVTMQSFIPLLLDGNKASERLDPFGTKARKLENYLLEENDGREERTGYLYMEFKRKESDTYMTIGIGLCARRNKKLDSWHFTITDGRRIGKDFWLYKDMKYKITLSRQELINRLGEGGQVIDGQKEYMRMVNEKLFGYETVEEYKELVDLLIQLRTPKLSKDFKPTVLNEILSSSLPPLSDDDLRPMSEAIENMDHLKSQLEGLEESKRAAEKILAAYRQYNERVLYEKAEWVVKDEAAYVKTANDIKGLVEKEKMCTRQLEEEKNRQEALELEQGTLEQEKADLDKNDASLLMGKKVDLEGKLGEQQTNYKNKKKSLDLKEEQFTDLEGKQKEKSGERDLLQEQVKAQLEEMQGIFEVLTFDEHEFMANELEGQLEEKYGFESILGQLEKIKNVLKEGIEVLRKENEHAAKYEELQVKQAKAEREKDMLQKELEELLRQCEQVKSEWIEKFYQWHKNNTELQLSDEVERKIIMGVEQYNIQSDFAELKDIVRKVKDDKLFEKQKDVLALNHQITLEQKNLEEKELELENWRQKKDPEPERSHEVQKNRIWLQEEGIPYEPFYKVIDFVEEVSVEQRNRIEEALFHMGLLDAVVVPSNYKNQVLVHREGQKDKYLFGEMANIKESVQKVLEVTMESDDIVFYQELSNLLGCIGIKEQGNTRITEAGFQLGILHGTITGEYEAKYIGTKAREAFRIEQIKCLEEEAEIIRKQVNQTLEEKRNLEECIDRLEKEYHAFPQGEDIKIATKDVQHCQEKLEKKQEETNELRENMEKQAKLLKEIRLQVTQICRKIYLKGKLEIFETAKEEVDSYEKEVYQLENIHQKYIHVVEILRNLEEQLENILADMDDLRYDLGKTDREIRGLQAEIIKCEEQLKIKDYEAIKERLEHCIKRLKEIPNELKSCYQKQTALEKDIENLILRKGLLEQDKEKWEKTCILSRKGFEDELALGYLEILQDTEFKNEREAAKYIVKILKPDNEKNSRECADKLQEQFHIYKGEMAEFGLVMKSLFFKEEYETYEAGFREPEFRRIDIRGKYKGKDVAFPVLLKGLTEDVEVQKNLVRETDRELFEDILAHTISKKIRYKIYKSEEWVDNMNRLMNSMNTSSGLKLSLVWKKKKAEEEGQLDTRELVELLKKDAGIMEETEIQKLSKHFQSKVDEARRRLEDEGNTKSFHGIMKEILDYRKWFEFQLYYQKTGEKKRELTNNAFFTFSGGEKAMAMYVPLFSAVVAKYQGAGEDAPRLVSLDEAFAGVDENNIRDMFRLMVELDFNFIINSQILWGDCDTVPSLAIYQLIRPENAKYVSVLPYKWNGKVKTICLKEEAE